MSSLYLIGGPRAIGKTTWVRNNIDTEYQVYISKDMIREDIVPPQANLYSKETQVNNRYIEVLTLLLNDDYDVFAEDLYTTIAARTKLIRRLPQYLYDELNIIFLKGDESIAINNNETRKNTRFYVKPNDIRQEYHHITEPSYEEGFDNIYIKETNKDIYRKEN